MLRLFCDSGWEALSYSDSFEQLWATESAYTRLPRARIIVWDGSPADLPNAIETANYLTPIDWALAMLLGTLPEQISPGNDSAKTTDVPVLVLDVRPYTIVPKEIACFKQDQSLAPRIRIIRPHEFLVTFVQFQGMASLSPAQPAETETISRLAKSLLELELESACDGLRHNHKNVLASMRLLLGAFCEGDVNEDHFNDAFEKLTKIGAQYPLLASLIKLHQQYARIKDTKSPKSLSKNYMANITGRVLVIDDHYYSFDCKSAGGEGAASGRSDGDHGWGVLYDALFSAGSLPADLHRKRTKTVAKSRSSDAGTVNFCRFIMDDRSRELTARCSV